MKNILTAELFDAWFAGLRNKHVSIRPRTETSEIVNRLVRVFQRCGFIMAGYRVYFVQRGMEVVILLAGGDKTTQAMDIKTALKIARQL
jgi:putative addiction module killer protein